MNEKDRSRINAYFNWDRYPLLVLSFRIELLTKLHDVDPMLTKRRAYGWSWVSLPTRHVEFDKTDNLFCHSILSSLQPSRSVAFQICIIELD